MKLLGVLLLFACGQSIANPMTAPDEILTNYRLKTDYIPTEYKIKLSVPENFETIKKFDGVATILLKKEDSAAAGNTLQFHMAEEIWTTVMIEINDVQFNKKKFNYNAETQIVTYALTNREAKSIETKLTFTYKGTLYEDMHGFYLSNINGQNYIATTQFEPIYARRAFPCFDEPQYKAKFQITIVVPTGFHALSNQPQIGNDKTVFDFEETPIMSTYLVAFVVSKFVSTKVEPLDGDEFSMNVWAPEFLQNNTKYAQKYSRKIIQNLGTLMGGGELNFPQMGIHHLDQVAVSDFSAGAMENWGLVTYRESALLVDNVKPRKKDEERVATVIAHEFAHSWFGNLVTMKWWKDAWLNEGFARYFEYHGLIGIEEMQDFQLDKQFVVNEVHNILEIDGNSGGLALSAKEGKVSTPQQITARFGAITYSKGGSIVRMMQKMIGKSFLKTLNNYLTINKYKNTEPDNLFTYIEEENQLGIEFNVIMNEWIYTSGYPMIKAKLDNGKVIVEQLEFSYDFEKKTKENTKKWYVPITHDIISSSVPTTTAAPGSSTDSSTTQSTKISGSVLLKIPTTNNGTITTTDGSPTTTDGSPTTTDGSPTTTDGSPTTTGGTTTTTDGSPTTTDGSPTTTDGSPTTTDGSPTTTDGSPTTTDGTTTPTTSIKLLKPTDKTIEIASLKNDEIIIVNPQNEGFYRVNYDSNLWQRIIKLLKERHTTIDVLTRAQLINDAMNLARANQLEYDIAMDLMDYLKNEVEYYPWKAALSTFSYLRKRLVNDELRERLNQKILILMNKFYGKNKNFRDNPDKAIDIYAKVLALEWTCELNGGTCVGDSKTLFTPASGRNLDDVNPNLKSIVYCNGLRQSDKTQWDQIYEEYKRATDAAKKVALLTALGCSRNTKILKAYLHLSITDNAIRPQDASTAFTAVLTGNPEGIDVCLEFLIGNIEAVAKKYNTAIGAMSKVILQLADRITTDEQMRKYKKFVKDNEAKLGDAAEVANHAIATVEANIKWAKYAKSKLTTILPNGAGQLALSSSLIGFCIVFMITRFA